MEVISGEEKVGGPPAAVSKSAQKKQLRLQRREDKKAERKAAEKDKRQRNAELRRAEWDERLASVTEEERLRLVDERRESRRQRQGLRAEERCARAERLCAAAESGPKLVIDLEFAHLMSTSEIRSLVHQVMYCYAANGRCASPVHLWLTGCTGKIDNQLKRIPGYDRWIIENECNSYIEALQDRKEDLVYLTADAETILDDLDPKKVYIVGGLVDRNRWKGVTMNKANSQGIKSAKLPIANYLRMSSSQVLTVNQVTEILLNYLETKDWRAAFFKVIPQRKRVEPDVEAKEYVNTGAADSSDLDIAIERNEKELEASDVDITIKDNEKEFETECSLEKKQRT